MKIESRFSEGNGVPDREAKMGGLMEEKTIPDPAAGMACPLPLRDHQRVLLAHGGGGKLSQDLIRTVFLEAFGNPILNALHDGAVLDLNGTRLAFTTDSYVVHPIVFPGGTIGDLAVNGTVNDLAMCGARPLYLSAGFILEEGFPIEDLRRVAVSMKRAAAEAGVALVTGDTKVVDRGKADKVFINTSGVGLIDPGVEIDPRRAAVGDRILLSGPIAAHGIAILSVREGLEFEGRVESDTAGLQDLVRVMLGASRDIHVLRDPTRGGVASAMNEIARQARVGIRLEEKRIPVSDEVRGACEILGLDPLYIANEGKLLAWVAPGAAERVLEAMRNHPLGREAADIGAVVEDKSGTVVMKSRVGGTRVVDLLSGEPLPRIC